MTPGRVVYKSCISPPPLREAEEGVAVEEGVGDG
jgi:hypothetical protein